MTKLRKVLINESSLSRIWQMIENDKSFGVVSAFRNGYSKKENEERHIELKEGVRDIGYGYVEMMGGYKEETGFVNEKSLFIPNINKSDIISLGIKFDQYSVIYKDSKEFVEIGTNKNSGIKKILNSFKMMSGRENLEMSKEVIKNFFSSLLKGSHRGKKFLFKLQEQEENSFNRMAYGDGRKNIPLKWYTIYEEKE